jgi:hypothetical protein
LEFRSQILVTPFPASTMMNRINYDCFDFQSKISRCHKISDGI